MNVIAGHIDSVACNLEQNTDLVLRSLESLRLLGWKSCFRLRGKSESVAD